MSFIYFSLCIFARFLVSFLKAQVNFPLNFASIFSAIRHNSSVLFLAQTLYTFVKGVNQRAIFLDFQVLESKFVKFLMWILKWQVNSSSNFALFFIAMTHNSSVNFKVIPFLLWTKVPIWADIKVPILTLSSGLVKICQISQFFF